MQHFDCSRYSASQAFPIENFLSGGVLEDLAGRGCSRYDRQLSAVMIAEWSHDHASLPSVGGMHLSPTSKQVKRKAQFNLFLCMRPLLSMACHYPGHLHHQRIRIYRISKKLMINRIEKPIII